ARARCRDRRADDSRARPRRPSGGTHRGPRGAVDVARARGRGTRVVIAGIGGDFAQSVLTGSMLVALPIAVLAGLVSFASPCVVPLVPGYLGYVSGMAGADTQRRGSRPRLLLGVSLFVLGFTAVFVTLGVAVSSLGVAVAPHVDLVLRVMGV